MKYFLIVTGLLLIVFLFLVIVVKSVQSEPTTFQNKIVEIHNNLRQTYGQVEALKFDPAISASCKTEAEKKVADYMANGKFAPNPDVQDRDYNDNTWVFLAFSTIRLNASRVLEDWSNQANYYDFEKNIFDWKTAHFTQVPSPPVFII